MKSSVDEDCVITEITNKEDERLEQEETKRPPPAGQTEKLLVDQEDDEQIRTAKVQMGEARQENQRLKQLLTNIAKEYQSFHTHFMKIIEQDHHEEGGDHPHGLKKISPLTHQVKHEPHELVSLSLGRSNSSELAAPKAEEIVKIDSNNSCQGEEDRAKFEEYYPSVPVKSPGLQNGVGEERPAGKWSPSKTEKNARSPDDHEVLEQPQMKKARVSVRARCDAPTMHDGCQWRKYGQKISKGNPCPRAYYRCTISPNCPVRKQVQRCVDDMSILITTYEGTHNHPLPLSATAMASATSAAASVLTSRSSTSHHQGGASSLSAPISASTTLPFPLTSSNTNSLNFSNHQFPYYFPTTSISNHNSHPTVTLDLTAPNNPAASSHYHFNNKFSQTCLNFSSPPPSTSWSNNHNFPTNYSFLGSKQPPNNNSMQVMNTSHQQQPASFTAEAITAATKVIIASSPTIRNALAAAITSFAGNNGSSTSPELNLKLGQSMGHNYSSNQAGGGYSSSNSQNGAIACGPSYLNKPNPSFGSHQEANLANLFPSFSPLASSRSSSESPPSSRDHVK